MRRGTEGNILAVTPDGAAPLDVGPDLLELVGCELTDWSVDHAVRCGYRLESILGAGGMGVAFLARVDDDETSVRSGGVPLPARAGRPLAGTRCVVKILLPQVVARESRIAEISFKKEVVALSRLAEKLPPSPFVVRYLDAGLLVVRTKAAQLFLPWCVMELVDGRPLGTTLDERLREARGPLEPARAAALIDGILRGVRAVHAVGLVHRDLKPSNVLVCGEPPNELPKISDFGVARALGVGDTFDVTVGTTGYAALEQLEGPSPKAREGGAKDGVGPWSDVFALGAILYEILAREGMYEAPSAMAFVGKVLARNFERLADRAERGALGLPWSTAAGRSLAARWDELLLRATSPRSPGGGTLGEGIPAPIRHRDVDELLDDVEPLLDAMRTLGASPRGSQLPETTASADSPSMNSRSVARVDESVVAARRWEWTIGPPLDASLGSLAYAACRSDGAVLAAAHGHASANVSSPALLFWNGESWTKLPARRGDDTIVGVLQGGAGAFVVVGEGGEVEVLPGGGGAFSFRLPFAVKRAPALAGHPLAIAHLALHTAHGEWVIARMQGRLAVPFARLGNGVEVHALVRDDRDQLIVGGRTPGRRGDESFAAVVDVRGRIAALPPLPGPGVSAMAIDADDALVVAGPGGIGLIDPDRSRIVLDVLDESVPEGCAVEALVALADGQVWGFAPGVVLRRGWDRRWRPLKIEPSLATTPVVAVAASGARVWSVHADGRVLAGRLSLAANPKPASST